VRLTVVGCSGSFPGVGSPASCYLLQAPDELTGETVSVVVDLGSGALGALQRYVRPDGIDAVLLSHMHPDHFMDLCGLYVARRYDPAGPAQPRLRVHGPSNALARLSEAYGEDGAGKMEHVYDVVPWVGDVDQEGAEPDDGSTVRVGPFTVTARRVDHPVEAYGMRVEHGGRVLAYSGDTDTCDALVELARDADVLLAEASFQEGRDDEHRGVHLTGRRAGEVATVAGARSLVLTHLPPWTDAAVVLAEAKGAYDGPVRVAAPGLVLDV
jgi:ribonuclease BN (tRNA processing enzyme)